jgi:hypothetical protein
VTSPNHTLQATPGLASLFFLARRLGAPELLRAHMCAILAAVLGILFTGCACRSAPPVTALPDHHEDWYVEKAVVWFEAQRAGYAAGQFSAPSIDGKDFDRSLPVKTEWEWGRSRITVWLPRSLSKLRGEWYCITLDARTGEVMNSGPAFLVY